MPEHIPAPGQETSAPHAASAPGTGRFLRPDIKLEPLVAGWHAFLQLLSPLQASHVLAHRYLPLLESFLRMPQVHLSASRNPSFYGGAFVELDEESLPAVRTLVEQTRKEMAGVLALAPAYRDVQTRLDAVGDGRSLDAIYEQVPAPLRGLLELAHDTSHRPSARIREALLHETGPQLAASQSLYMHAQPDDARRFFLNTPRLACEGELLIPLPFHNAAWDRLAAARTTPVDVDTLAEELQLLDAHQRATFASFFQDHPPEREGLRFQGDGVRITYMGHACVLLETREVVVLLDPTFAYTPGPGPVSRTLSDLPDWIDYVVISHGHQDHLCLEALLQLRTRIGVILVPPNNPGQLEDASMALALRQLGFPNLRVLEQMERVVLPGNGELTSLPFAGEHCGLDIQSKQCVALSLAGRRIVFLVDSDAIDPDLYTRLASRIGPVDVAFVGMECEGAPLNWLYGPLLQKPISRAADQSRRGNGSDAAKAGRVVAALGPSEVYVYAMGMERWNRHLLGLEYAVDSPQIRQSDQFVAACRAEGRMARRLNGCEVFAYAAAAPRPTISDHPATSASPQAVH